MTPRNPKTLAVVLGMHRGGTSLLSKAMAVFGFEHGDRLLPPQPDNPKGFYEDADIVGLNEEMLACIGQKWDTMKSVRQTDVGRLESEGFISRARSLLAGKLEAHPRFAMKDPRLAKLLGAWRRALDNLPSTRVIYVVAVRHPVAIAASLIDRDARTARSGFRKHEVFWNWVINALTIAEHCPPRDSICVEYEGMVADPEDQLRRMSRELRLEVIEQRLESFAGEFVDPLMQHFRATENAAHRLPRLVREIYAHQQSAARGSFEPAEKAVLEKWREDVSDWEEILSLSGETVKLARQAEEMKITLSVYSSKIADLELGARKKDKTLEELRAALVNRDAAAASAMASLQQALTDVKASTCWKITRPIRWIGVTTHRIAAKASRLATPTDAPSQGHSGGVMDGSCMESDPPTPIEQPTTGNIEESERQAESNAAGRSLDVVQWLDSRWPNLIPIRTFPVPGHDRRITIVTDSVGTSSLFGGVGTALVLGALAANRLGASLRLVTRLEEPDTGAMTAVLEANKVEVPAHLETAFLPPTSRGGIPVSAGDFFLTTSWWTTRSTLDAVGAAKVFYLLQEDERMFYHFGDDRLRCEDTLNERGLHAAVNSKLLFDHLAQGASALLDFGSRASWFEPAFPGSMRTRSRQSEKRRLFFYARPDHARNLFSLGLEALHRALNAGVFPRGRWDIYMVGRNIPALALPDSRPLHSVEGLSWADYQELVASMDAGFSLMSTPHPSYPPLDLAAAGAAVLTNQFGNKSNLSSYSRNIITAAPNVPALTEGLRLLERLAVDDEARRRNAETDNIARDWHIALADVVETIGTRFKTATESSQR